MIALTGGRDPKTKFKQVYQEIDDVPVFEPVTKFNATVDSVERFPDMVRSAFRIAVSGTPGPVHLQFRGNEGQIDQESADMQPRCATARFPRPSLSSGAGAEQYSRRLGIAAESGAAPHCFRAAVCVGPGAGEGTDGAG